MNSLIHRAGGSLAVKALPALYGAGLILLIVRTIPLGDFGRYGMAIAYVNLISALSRGLWAGPLVIRAARGERDQILGPAFWFSAMTAVAGAALGLVILPLLGVGFELALIAAVMLLILVPRDLALALAQAASRVWDAFLIEAGYFVGSLAGFAYIAINSEIATAEAAMLVNLIAAGLSAALGLLREPCLLRPRMHGDWKGAIGLGRWIGILTLGEIFLQQGDALIVGMFFSPEMIAPYIAARTLLRMYTLFSQAVNFLVLPSASRSYADGQVHRFRHRLRNVMKAMLALLLPVNIFMYWFSPTLFPLVLGAKYIPAMPFFRLMILATFLEPVYSILTNAISGIGKPQKVVPIQLLALSVSVVLNLVLLSVTHDLRAAAIVLVLTYGTLAYGMVRLARKHLVNEL